MVSENECVGKRQIRKKKNNAKRNSPPTQD